MRKKWVFRPSISWNVWNWRLVERTSLPRCRCCSSPASHWCPHTSRSRCSGCLRTCHCWRGQPGWDSRIGRCRDRNRRSCCSCSSCSSRDVQLPTSSGKTSSASWSFGSGKAARSENPARRAPLPPVSPPSRKGCWSALCTRHRAQSGALTS